MSQYADIILPVPLQKLFTYSVPEEMNGDLEVGSRVVVQFGKKKSYSGIVRRLHDEKPEYETKPIQQVVDQTPIVVDRQLRMWDWMADYYCCSLGEIYRAALPSGLKLESESRLIYNADFEADAPLSERQEMILNFVELKKVCTISDVQQYVSTAEDEKMRFNVLPQIKKLLSMDALFISEELRDAYKPKTDVFYGIASEYRSDAALSEWMEKLSKAPKQLESLMQFLSQAGGLTKAKNGGLLRRETASKAGMSTTALNELVKKGLLTAEKQNISRIENGETATEEAHELSEEQQRAMDEIEGNWKEKTTTLLMGVTSSGKTEIYIHLIKKCIAEGRQALYLLPEIALTTQITQRLRKHFGKDLGVYHSKFNDAERVEVWNKLLAGNEYKVILGVRSSIMLPFRDLGLIIVDEEHETSYKQFDPAPRYNARDMANVLALIHGGKVLMGSATPSYESYNNAMTGRYGYVELKKRYAGIEMPEIVTVDMKEARHKKLMHYHEDKSASIFSLRLKETIDKALRGGEQVILFQNRRGFSPYVECTQCAWVPKCENCDVSLTYHKNTHQLVCHYCSYTIQLPQTCPCCGNPRIEPQGYGTEKIEEEVKSVFPEARVVRMDLDTARSRQAYEKIIGDFENYKYDILVGTQMISKGLDFERVSTVGIMNADNMLNMPDFRAYERCFQMISQVSGRAGRHGKRGQVILQTRQADHNVVRHIVENDYEANAREQLAEREMYHYPPFDRMVNIIVKHKEWTTAQHAAMEAGYALKSIFGNRVLGPQEPEISRIATYYLERIIVKIDKGSSPAKVKAIMTDCMNRILSQDQYKGVLWNVDVDPY
ncbi:MAG: primosomal protein N' [Bacteroidales bacterium]|nr:primosomal protein N' [Bacteroidales bacterium]